MLPFDRLPVDTPAVHAAVSSPYNAALHVCSCTPIESARPLRPPEICNSQRLLARLDDRGQAPTECRRRGPPHSHPLRLKRHSVPGTRIARTLTKTLIFIILPQSRAS